MNVDVDGRIVKSGRSDGRLTFHIDSNHRISSRQGSQYFSFRCLHDAKQTNYDIYKTSVQTLSEMFLDGFNVCLLVLGQSGSGKSFTLAGEGENAGIVQMTLDHLFSRISDLEPQGYRHSGRQRSLVSLHMYELYSEVLHDLLHDPAEPIVLDESAERGVYVRGSSGIPITDAEEAISLFRKGWSKKTNSMTDYGPAQNYATTIITIRLTLPVANYPYPNISKFTIVELPGLEKLGDDMTSLRYREGPSLSKSLVSFNVLSNTLATQPYPDRVVSYRESKLTRILQDELGGNCRTRVLVCMKQKSDPDLISAVVKTCSELEQIKNFPVANDCVLQNLVTQYRAKILSLEQTSGMATDHTSLDFREDLRGIQIENMQLRDKNERLQAKLDSMQGKFGYLATSKTDISQQLLSAEEEKLKVSKALIDMQIENNKLKEEMEAAKFELTNKVLMLENDLMELELERDRHAKAARMAKSQFDDIQRDRKDLADEYIKLKANNQELSREHEKQVARNEELSLELINLINSQAALQRDNQETDRVRAMVSRLSNRRMRPEDIVAAEKERLRMEQKLFGNERRFREEVDRMKEEYNQEQGKAGSKMSNVQRELQDARNKLRENQQKLSKIQAKMITTQGDRDHLETDNNRLQHKLKDVNEEYRIRLIKYVEDIGEFVDQGVPDHTTDRMRDYIDQMLKDIKKSHKAREEQLSDAAHAYKGKLQDVVNQHEQVIVAYRQLRLEAEEKGLDLGPDETTFRLTQGDLHSANQKEIFRLKEELTRIQHQIETHKYSLGDMHTKNMRPTEGKQENWSSIRRTIKEYSQGSQMELERERAQLFSEKEVLCEEVRELKDYIDNHLVRYKQEIVRLRKMLGMDEDGKTRLK